MLVVISHMHIDWQTHYLQEHDKGGCGNDDNIKGSVSKIWGLGLAIHTIII